MKYVFLILALTLMLLPEVTPGNRVVFGNLLPKNLRAEITEPATRSLSNCPATSQDSYVKQALCSCKTMFRESEQVQVSENTEKQQAPKNITSEGNYFSRFFRFISASQAAE